MRAYFDLPEFWQGYLAATLNLQDPKPKDREFHKVVIETHRQYGRHDEFGEGALAARLDAFGL